MIKLSGGYPKVRQSKTSSLNTRKCLIRIRNHPKEAPLFIKKVEPTEIKSKVDSRLGKFMNQTQQVGQIN